MERAQRHRHPLVLLGASALPGVDRGRGARGVPASGSARPGRRGRDRLEPAGAGRGHGQGPAGWEKTGRNPTAGSPARRGGRPGQAGEQALALEDGRGVPLGPAVAGANRNDHKPRRETLEAIPVERPKPTAEGPQGLCLDKGYDYDEPRALAVEFGFTLHLRTRGEEVQAKREAGTKARRWVVERTHSRLNRFRRILVRWEKRPDTYLAMLPFALGLIAWRHASLAG